ncbi:MAG: YbaK/EbsC family protein [Alphaproteobacteria bacterium]|jgi:Ala-tRNA(Pro) deacylase|nr:YbaK/EbsC family protein [Alphaproteobacteria bacterium]
MAIAITLKEYLADRGVDYDVVTHAPTGSSSQTAQVSHIPGDRIAKAVILKDDDGYVMAVLPSTHHIDLGAVCHLMERSLALATEEDVVRLFADCDMGAVPALGSAYGMSVIMDDSLAAPPEIYFEGGDHASLVHVSGMQFQDLMADSRRGQFSDHD